MEAFIKGIGIVSPQNTTEGIKFLSEVVEYNSGYMSCVEPVYSNYISPVISRKLSRILKLSIVASKVCLSNSSIETPDAIITGTGLGCIQNTEDVLNSILENNESFIVPTSFIHSTHNTISSQIAIYLKCHGQNLTFSHRTFSFESAVLYGMIYLADKYGENVLVGGVDEMTPTLFDIGSKLIFKSISKSNLNMLNEKNKGAYAGEGMAFFTLSSNYSEGDYAKIKVVETIYNPDSVNSLKLKIEKAINSAGLSIGDIDAVMLGITGNSESNRYYQELINSLLKNKILLYYKHLCGEYFTSSSFALWCCANILKRQFIPSILRLNKNENNSITNILIYNQFNNKNHSIMLLGKC